VVARTLVLAAGRIGGCEHGCLGGGLGGALVLAVGIRFAVEIIVRPAEPFSIYLPEGRK
jgi:hypothetical protein